MMDPNMSESYKYDDVLPGKRGSSLPLQIIRPWISMLLLRTKRANISRRVMHKTMSNHLILALEALSTNTPRAAWNRTIVRTLLGMYICMRAAHPN